MFWNENATKRKYYKGQVHSMPQNGVICSAGCTKSIFVRPTRFSAFVGRLRWLSFPLQTSSNRRLLQVQLNASQHALIGTAVSINRMRFAAE
jgi:hypothetical protein